jgi:hypothetical protein
VASESTAVEEGAIEGKEWGNHPLSVHVHVTGLNRVYVEASLTERSFA